MKGIIVWLLLIGVLFAAFVYFGGFERTVTIIILVIAIAAAAAVVFFAMRSR
jgi:hypothetical protein